MAGEKIKKLIDTNLDAAFEELDKIFGKNNGIYNDLCDEFYSRKENFSYKTYRSKLKRFVSGKILYQKLQ